MSIPNTGDPVTYLDGRLLVHCRWGYKEENMPRGAYVLSRRGIAGAVPAGAVDLSGEGSTWVRGHVTENDDAGKALLVAGVLASSDSGGQEYLRIVGKDGSVRYIPVFK